MGSKTKLDLGEYFRCRSDNINQAKSTKGILINNIF